MLLQERMTPLRLMRTTNGIGLAIACVLLWLSSGKFQTPRAPLY